MKLWGKDSRKVNSAVFTFDNASWQSQQGWILWTGAVVCFITVKLFNSGLKKHIWEMGGDIGVPGVASACSLLSVGVFGYCGAAVVIMRLLPADVVLNLLSLPITPSWGHRPPSPNKLCIVVRKSIHIKISKQRQMNVRGGQLYILPHSSPALLCLDWTTYVHFCKTASFKSVCWFEEGQLKF